MTRRLGYFFLAFCLGFFAKHAGITDVWVRWVIVFTGVLGAGLMSSKETK